MLTILRYLGWGSEGEMLLHKLEEKTCKPFIYKGSDRVMTFSSMKLILNLIYNLHINKAQFKYSISILEGMGVKNIGHTDVILQHIQR